MRELVLTVALVASSLAADVQAKSAKLWLAEFSALAAAADGESGDLNGPAPLPSPIKVPRAECKVCKGTGKIRSGDGISVVDCDSCYPPVQDLLAEFCGCGDDCDCLATGDNCGCQDTELASAGDCPGGACAAPKTKKKRWAGSCASGNCGAGRPAVRAATAPVRALRAARPLRRAAAAVNRLRPLRRVASWFAWRK